MNIDNEKFRKILKQRKLRLTGARLALYDFMSEHNRPLSVNKLVASLSAKADRASVYRNIELFEKIGVINKVFTGWKYRIELSEQFRPHHHHLTCQKCGKSIPISLGERMEKAIESFGEKHDFKITGHQIELHGLCKNCY
jgi:Fe2+ or Zn2+ uptake regulation protein